MNALHGAVADRTRVDERYLVSAAHQSMTVYLADWERAYALLGRRIEELRWYRDVRRSEAEQGSWPYPVGVGRGC